MIKRGEDKDKGPKAEPAGIVAMRRLQPAPHPMLRAFVWSPRWANSPALPPDLTRHTPMSGLFMVGLVGNIPGAGGD